MAKLCVKVLSTHGLMPKDRQGTASAFVVLSSGSQQCRTSTKFKDVSPTWNEIFYFDMPFQGDLVLDASVYGVNKSVQSSRLLLGGFRVNASPSHTDIPLMYLPLETGGVFSQETKIFLGLKLNVIHEPNKEGLRLNQNFLGPNVSSLRGSTATRLCVEVVSAQDLKPSKDKLGSTCTFVELSFDYHRLRTAVEEKDLMNPVWNELVYFDVWDPSSLPTLVLEACVYSANKSIKRYRYLLGELRLDCSSFSSNSDGPAASYHPLKKSGMFWRGVTGKLCLRAYITNEPSIRAPDPIYSPQLHVSSNLESIQSSTEALPLQYLKEITNNFSEERILGEGGFGVVYKGVLQNGEMIAVKRIKPSFVPAAGRKNQFEDEVIHLIRLKHPNIVRFIGYCYGTQNQCLEYNGKHIFAEELAERLLCLEYLPNGSLDKYLSDESSGLNWSTRYKIIEGICYGLCHLHEHDKPIIHLDLKPANILLDDDMVPKITDFGLSRLLDQQQTICTSSLDGTLGYMAHEFLHGGKISPMSDIFSLGVIIMEVITGHKDYPYYPYVTRASADDYIELALTKWRDMLQRSPGYESLESDCEQIKRCIQIGLICVNHDRKKRPPIMKVISMLQGLDIIDWDISNEEA